MKLYLAARAMAAWGLSVIPVCADGSKRPALASWKPYQERLAADHELREWFDPSTQVGIAIIGGNVSGNLEIIDFDKPDLFPDWCEAAEERAPGLVERLVLVETPTGGWHCYFRSDAAQGNLKLAQYLDGEKIKTAIETRGEGGYVLAPGSPPECHPAHKPYILFAGSFSEIPLLNTRERSCLMDSARLFNEVSVSVPNPVSGKASNPTTEKPTTGRAGDDYSERVNWYELLSGHGWHYTGRRGGVQMWKRPGKDEVGISATVNFAGSNMLYVFSTNCWPFEAGRGYSGFSAYALLEHGGDFKQAARALRAQGYGIAPARTVKLERPGKPETIKPERPGRPETVRLPLPARPQTIILPRPGKPQTVRIERPNEDF